MTDSTNTRQSREPLTWALATAAADGLDDGTEPEAIFDRITGTAIVGDSFWAAFDGVIGDIIGVMESEREL